MRCYAMKCFEFWQSTSERQSLCLRSKTCSVVVRRNHLGRRHARAIHCRIDRSARVHRAHGRRQVQRVGVAVAHGRRKVRLLGTGLGRLLLKRNELVGVVVEVFLAEAVDWLAVLLLFVGATMSVKGTCISGGSPDFWTLNRLTVQDCRTGKMPCRRGRRRTAVPGCGCARV